MSTKQPTIEELRAKRDSADQALADAIRALSEASSRVAKARKAQKRALNELVQAKEARLSRGGIDERGSAYEAVGSSSVRF